MKLKFELYFFLVLNCKQINMQALRNIKCVSTSISHLWLYMNTDKLYSYQSRLGKLHVISNTITTLMIKNQYIS